MQEKSREGTLDRSFLLYVNVLLHLTLRRCRRTRTVPKTVIGGHLNNEPQEECLTATVKNTGRVHVIKA